MKGTFVLAVILVLAACSGDGEATATLSSADTSTAVGREATVPASRPAETTVMTTTTTSQSTTTTTLAAIPGSQPSILAGGHEFAIVGAGFDNSVFGMEPAGFGAGDQVLFVEFELLEGDRSSFEALEILVSDEMGQRSAVVLIASGSMQMLADLTMTGAAAEYEPDPDSTTWTYVVPSGAAELRLVFPSGEVVDLTPVLP